MVVAVDDPLPVRLVQGIGDLGAVSEHLFGRQRSPHEASRQRLALERLHHEVVGLALPPDVVEGADVRVRE